MKLQTGQNLQNNIDTVCQKKFESDICEKLKQNQDSSVESHSGKTQNEIRHHDVSVTEMFVFTASPRNVTHFQFFFS